MRQRRSRSAAPDTTLLPPDPDQAWRALSLVNDWVKHAEVKLGVVLTATGVSGGILFNLAKDRRMRALPLTSRPSSAVYPCSVLGVAP